MNGDNMMVKRTRGRASGRRNGTARGAIAVAFSIALLSAGAKSTAQVHGDFNADGFDDIAVGVPFEDVGTKADAGAVNVIYGSSNGPTATGNQLWHQDLVSIGGTAEPNSLFGLSLASGDFNGDGFDDLAIGAPGSPLHEMTDAGKVHALYGSAAGLTSTSSDFWYQGSGLVGSTTEAGDMFGYSLASADFNRDGFDDLAIGAPFEDLVLDREAGVVHVILGTADGLRLAGNQLWHQDSGGVLDSTGSDDYFGFSLAASDFSCDGFADLAIGVFGEDLAGIEDAGAVCVLYSAGGAGLSSANNQLWEIDAVTLSGFAPNEQFGYSLASGDFNGGSHDLAIGIPGWARSRPNAGAVVVLRGSCGGLVVRDHEFLSQLNPGMGGGGPAPNEQFGLSLAAGNFNGDSVDDLVIGVPGEAGGVGGMQILKGTSSGLDPVKFVRGTAAGDAFGFSLSVGDFNGDGRDDIAVGIPFADTLGRHDAGAVRVFASGKAFPSQTWHQGRLSATLEADDHFGYALNHN